jgi:hypothetical protein
MNRLRFSTLGLAATLAIAGCRRERPAAASPSVEPPPPAAVTAEADVDERLFAFTAADLDAWERGMKKEIELFQAAQARGAAAKTPEERARAAQAGFETATAPEAAKAIGADPERYLKTRRSVDLRGRLEGTDGPRGSDLDRVHRAHGGRWMTG